jgi:hypothetical protein
MKIINKGTNMTLSQIENKLKGLDKIGGGVNTKKAAYAAWDSITSLLDLSKDTIKWEQEQVLSKSYYRPIGFHVSSGNRATSTQVVGHGRDSYLKNISASLDVSGSYGGFSGTLHSSFDMTEDTTEAYSFGTQTFVQELYTLTLPHNLDGLLDAQFEEDLNGSMSPTEFYDAYGTHYTSSILMGAKASLSLYSQLKNTYSESTFKADLSAAYEGIVGDFKTTGKFSYESKESHETYNSSSSLVLVGGNTKLKKMEDWKTTIEEFPEFIDFNTHAADIGLVPIYKILKQGKRHDELKAALPDYLNPPLEIRIFCAASTLDEHPSALVQVPPGYKILSGGAKADYVNNKGVLLTASYPIGDNQWTAKAKDADEQDYAILTVYAVAVYDPHDWLDVKVFHNKSANSDSHPVASVSVDSDYAMTGGGAKVDFVGAGNNLTASYPISDNTWSVASKDHVHQCQAIITAYAIGVKWSSKATNKFPGLQAIKSQYLQDTSNSEAHPSATVAAPNDTTMVGGGALDDYGTGPGNMLYASYPLNANTWRANGKDHSISSYATLTTYAIGVSNMVNPTLTSS